MMVTRCIPKNMAHFSVCLGWLATVLLLLYVSYEYEKDMAQCTEMLNRESLTIKEQNSINLLDSRRSNVDDTKDQDGNAYTTEYEIENCQTIHLAFICGGHNSTRDLYTLLKSILFYRTNSKLKLHIFVNNVSSSILRELFKTWLVPDLEVNYYNMSKYEHDVAWIPNQHYSHRFGLLKLLAPLVLADVGLEKVIFLDTDLLVMGNIEQLWREFKQKKSLQRTRNYPPDNNDENPRSASFISLVENQSDWYQNDTSSSRPIAWPALGQGFNTGVMLVDLVKLKQANWDVMWRSVAESELISYLSTTLADQDIYNAIIKKNEWIVSRLDCRYNLQLNDNTKLDWVCPNHRYVKGLRLIHWNSPYKLNTKNREAIEYYNSWYQTFRSWDAKLLQREACRRSVRPEELFDSLKSPGGDISTPIRSRKLEELCREIRPRSDEGLRTFLYYLDFELDDSLAKYKADVSIVVHLSLDRIRALDELASHWEGPMSAAIYLGETDIQLFLDSIENSESLSKRKNIGYHLVFRDHGFNYPINRLRNIALNNSVTSYVFMTDVDFLPTFGLYGQLLSVIRNMNMNSNSGSSLQDVALVVPAFESKEYKLEFPGSKRELIKQLDLGMVTRFRESLWPQGQAATDYDKWKVSTQPYEIAWRPEYEPFVVTSRNVTRYDERFNGFGWNKVQHIMQLAALNYKFLVLPESFSIHQFHPASYDISMHRKSKKYQACIRLMKATFISELRVDHPGRFENVSLSA